MYKFRMTAILLLLVLWLASGCATYGSNESRIVTGGDFVLKSSESLNGNLVILGGNSTLQKDSRVNGVALTRFGTRADAPPSNVMPPPVPQSSAL